MQKKQHMSGEDLVNKKLNTGQWYHNSQTSIQISLLFRKKKKNKGWQIEAAFSYMLVCLILYQYHDKSLHMLSFTVTRATHLSGGQCFNTWTRCQHTAGMMQHGWLTSICLFIIQPLIPWNIILYRNYLHKWVFWTSNVESQGTREKKQHMEAYKIVSLFK